MNARQHRSSRYIAEETIEVEFDEFGDPLPAAVGENFIPGDGDFKNDRLTIVLAPDKGIEYKALLDQGDTITYHWSVDNGQVYFDLHAHDTAFGPDFFTRYAEGEAFHDAGAIVAAYDGQHGWYWLNLEAEPVTIVLEVSGFYDDIIRIEP